ncbi:MAG: trypsin-like peptidase domain-containing protein [Pseudomonadota bacterium]
MAAGIVGAVDRPARAIVILDSTWRAEGGRPGREKDGFRAHIALANQPQFDSLIALSEDEGEEWDDASGTWLGNFGGAGYVLTAGHVFKRGETADKYLYRTQRGTVHEGVRVVVHPRYNGDGNTRSGYDVAVVRLDGAVTDAGPPPLLFAGPIKVGLRVVIVGFGSRGLGSTGEQDVYDNPASNKTAAENTVDEVTAPTTGDVRDEDSGNWLRVTLRRESEGGSRLDGILGGGDSGGSVWARFDGRWYVVAVNATGTGDRYGEHSYFARLAGVRPWLANVLPGLRFAP